MALSKEVLKANATLAELTEDQLAAIETMSTNEENSTFGAKFSTLLSEFDQVVESVTGQKKSPTMKTSEFVKSSLEALKAGAADPAKLTEATNKIKELEEQIKSGSGDKGLISKLESTIKAKEQQIADLGKAKETVLSEWQEKYNNQLAANEKLNLSIGFNEALAGKKWKAGIDDATAKMIIDAQVDSILSGTIRETIVGTDGKEVTVFKDQDGKIIGDPNNNMAPISSGALLLSKLGGILDQGKVQTGTGQKGGEGNPSGQSDLDLTGAKTKVEATKMIDEHLLSKGISTTNEKYKEQREALIEPVKDQFESLPGGYF